MRFDTDTRMSVDEVAASLKVSRDKVQRYCWQHGIGESLGKDRALSRDDVKRLRAKMNQPTGRKPTIRTCPVDGCGKMLSGREYHRHVYECPTCGAFAHRSSTPGAPDHGCKERERIKKMVEEVTDIAARQIKEIHEWRKKKFAEIDEMAKAEKKEARKIANMRIEEIRERERKEIEDARKQLSTSS